MFCGLVSNEDRRPLIQSLPAEQAAEVGGQGRVTPMGCTQDPRELGGGSVYREGTGWAQRLTASTTRLQRAVLGCLTPLLKQSSECRACAA